MVTVNSISGGKTSGFLAFHYPADVNIFACVCIDYPKAAPKDPAVLNYCLSKLNGNFIASAEHEKTLRVMMQLEQGLGKEIIWVRGKSFDTVIDEAGCLPTWARRFCTTEMKITPMFEYLWPRYGVVRQNIGFRYDEFERSLYKEMTEIEGKQVWTGRWLKKEKGYMSYPISCNNFGNHIQNWDHEILWQEKQYPLIDNVIFHQEIRNFWKFKHPEYDFPFDSNCRGCHHKAKELIKQNHIETPDVLEWFSLQEQKKKLKGGRFHTFMDDGIMYRDIFKMNFTEKIDFDYTMCNSGGCTD